MQYHSLQGDFQTTGGMMTLILTSVSQVFKFSVSEDSAVFFLIFLKSARNQTFSM
jgi:hypothetical protein